MFRLKRFRLFLFLAILAIITLYEFSRVNSWDDLTTLKDLGVHHDAVGTTTSLTLAATPLPTRSAAASLSPVNASPSFLQPKPSSVVLETTASESAAPVTKEDDNVITGEELLAQKSTYEEDFIEHGQGRLEIKPRPSDRPKPRWQLPKQHFPVQKPFALPSGEAQLLPKIQYKFSSESSRQKTERVKKQTAVREAFKHAWAGYKQFAYGHDELRPLSNSSADTFNGWGATLVDALDTMWIMGLKDDFEDAVLMVAKIDFKTSPRKDIPLFETTIRYLGGLLAAYDISEKRYTALLDKAIELADILMGAFDTPNRMPIPYYHWAPSYSSQPHRTSPHIVMAELGSLAMEFTRLSQLTKENKYYDAIARVTNALEEWQMKTTYPGLWPVKLDASGCKKPEVDKVADLPDTYAEDAVDEEIPSEPDSNFAKRQLDDASIAEDEQPAIPPDSVTAKESSKGPDKVVSYDDEDDEENFNADCDPQGLNFEPHSKSQVYSIAAMADSTYEYFPKMHALLGSLNSQYKSMYEKSMDVIRSDFLFRPMIKEKRDILFLAKQKLSPKAKEVSDRKKTIYEGSHLGCFVGGMFALGSKIFDIPGDMKLAEKLTDACVWAYDSTPLGIMPELFEMVPCEDTKSCKWNETRWHEFLDPQLKERVDAVEQYNKKQEALLAATDEDSELHEHNAESAPATDAHLKRDSGDGLAAATKTLNADPFSTANNGDTTVFHPKIALSHAKYVSARISEERLPPGYTNIESPDYRLRPEAIESVFIMYRLTGSETWREKGWKMFTAVERATRTRSGHAAIKDVTSSLGHVQDSMESFWLAETLKYYYLLFSEESLVSLDDWSLNTEAHPFRIPQAGTTL